MPDLLGEVADKVWRNAREAVAGVANIVQAELHARLMQEAAKQAAEAEPQRLADIAYQADIEAHYPNEPPFRRAEPTTPFAIFSAFKSGGIAAEFDATSCAIMFSRGR